MTDFQNYRPGDTDNLTNRQIALMAAVQWAQQWAQTSYKKDSGEITAAAERFLSFLEVR